MDRLIDRLNKKNFNAYYARDRVEARQIALSLIPEGAVIGMGNSLTLRETGIYDALVSGDYRVINQFESGISPEENLRRRKLGLTSDVYFTGTNAITMNGELVNIDGKGNRVAAMMFGPERVIVVAGKNKIAGSVEEAWNRLKSIAPSLAKRLGRSTPCSRSGVCSDCSSQERICRFYTVIDSLMPSDRGRISLIIVGEDLGL